MLKAIARASRAVSSETRCAAKRESPAASSTLSAERASARARSASAIAPVTSRAGSSVSSAAKEATRRRVRAFDHTATPSSSTRPVAGASMPAASWINVAVPSRSLPTTT